MPNPNNRITGDQWDTCALCDRPFPIGDLMMQKGRLVCSDDYDDPEVERREMMIARALASAPEEGSDRRPRKRMQQPVEEIF